VIDTGHAPISPTGSHPPSRSSSFVKSSSPGASRTPKGAKLFYEDFWPSCLNDTEQKLYYLEFESFDSLIPRANAWLQEHTDTHLIKCETVEKKVSTTDEVDTDGNMFRAKGNSAIYIKGLRLWYVTIKTHIKDSTENVAPSEIGYMNVIPKCIDSTGMSRKYPIYENLPETYAAVNAYLSDSPLEGRIITIETVGLKLPRNHWDGPEVDPDQTFFIDEYLRHVLYITRIYFVYGAPEEELIGAQDFLPDFVHAPRWYSIYGIYPKYRPLGSAMQKIKDWIQSARNIRITNVQCLEAVYKKHPENVHTGVNFVEKIESCAMIRFMRVTYVRPLEDQIECMTMYSPPKGFGYKTFVPAAVKVGMCSGAPEYESLVDTWERAKSWLKCVDRRVIGVETFYHPMSRIWHNQDLGETTVMQGEWTTTHRGERRHRTRRQLVHIIRVYLDGEFTEPPPHHLPPAPRVEEVNDCRCTIM